MKTLLDYGRSEQKVNERERYTIGTNHRLYALEVILITLRAKLYFVIGPVSGFVCVCVCVCVCVYGSVTTITRNCVCRFSPNSVCR